MPFLAFIITITYFLSVKLLIDPVHLSPKHGYQEAYQSIPVGILLFIGSSVFSYYFFKVARFKLNLSDDEKKRRNKRLLALIAAIFFITALSSISVRNNYGIVKDFNGSQLLNRLKVSSVFWSLLSIPTLIVILFEVSKDNDEDN